MKRSESEETPVKTLPRKRRKLDKGPVPKIYDLKSLIEFGRKKIYYRNINCFMLWNIIDDLVMLDNMVGMEKLKETIFYQIIYYLLELNKRSPNDYLHTVILGPPGCGKTTISQIIGELYKKMGIISKDGIFKIAKREDFVGEYLGQTAIKTKKLLKSCLGGVLFIDEAYALGPGQKDRDSFSKEAIDTLNAFLSENKDNFCCIIAGYENDIKKCFFSVNQGLERRFQWVHRISEYNNKDLSNIFMKMIKEINWETNISLKDIENLIKNDKDMFSYLGGDIENLLAKCKLVHARRVFGLDAKHRFILTMEDFKEAIEMMKENNMKDQDDKFLLSHMYV